MWRLQEAKQLVTQALVIEQMVMTKVETHVPVLGQISELDIIAMIFAILLEAAKSAQDDLKSIMAGSIPSTMPRQRRDKTRLPRRSRQRCTGIQLHIQQLAHRGPDQW